LPKLNIPWLIFIIELLLSFAFAFLLKYLNGKFFKKLKEIKERKAQKDSQES